MNSSASSADERVSGVDFTEDALSVTLPDGRVISVPSFGIPACSTLR